MNRSRVKFAHGTLVLNEHYTDANPPAVDSSKYQDTITLDRVRVRPQYRTTLDPLHLARGAQAGKVHAGPLFLSVQGRILVPDATHDAKMADRERTLRSALDPGLCYSDSPSTDGVYALDWLDPTTDTVNFATGWAPRRYYVRPIGQPETVEDIKDGPYRGWSCDLVAPDPRCYSQTLTSVTVNGTPSWTGAVPNIGTAPAPLRVTITMSGPGATDFTITRSGVAFILNLSGLINTDPCVVDMETCGPFGLGRRISKYGVDFFSFKTSGPSTWLDVPVGGGSFVATNTTNVASILYETRAAWA